MRNLSTGTVYLLSVLFGLATVALVWFIPRHVGAAIPSAPKSVYLVVARENIAPRTTIRLGMVTIGKFPGDGSFIGQTSTSAVVGRVALRALPAGEPIPPDAVQDKSIALGLAYAVNSNMRAVAVPIDQVTGVAGYLKPGDHVDVLATYSGQDVEKTVTILQNVELLAIGGQETTTTTGKEDPNKPHPDAPTALLQVWPSDAQPLVLAASRAKIHLTLRPPDDQIVELLRPATVDRVFSVAPSREAAATTSPVTVPEVTPAPVAPRPAAPAVHRIAPATPDGATVSLTRGTEQTLVKLP